MNLTKSIDFLLEHAGPVIQYRLRKEILKDLTQQEEEKLLKQVKLTPHYKLVESYVKPNGYIGLGMHSWDKFKATPLEDGETAARLLAYYAIPKESPLIVNYIRALRDEKILEAEFSYYKPEMDRFRTRYIGLNNGGGLMVLVYTMQALLGYGDDEEVKPFLSASYQSFKSMLSINSLDEITSFNPNSKKKYNYPYVLDDVALPCCYHLTALSYTSSWRNEESIKTMADALNHINKIMKEGNNVHIKIGSKYYVPLGAFVTPLKPFEVNRHSLMMRRTLTEIAGLGVGEHVDIVRQSVENLKEALAEDGILRYNFSSAYEKKRFLDSLRYPLAYNEVGLEADYKKETSIWCDLTFWAVQFLHLLGQDK